MLGGESRPEPLGTCTSLPFSSHRLNRQELYLRHHRQGTIRQLAKDAQTASKAFFESMGVKFGEDK